MNEKLISIITVSYNCKERLEKTILSVINQNYTNFEYIIIDGNSNDGTKELLNSYEEKFSYCVSEPDNGIYDAMNKGIAHTKGQWILFMNAGDVFYNDDVLNIFSKYMTVEKCLYGDYIDLSKDAHISQKKIKNFYIVNICHQSIFYNRKYIECFDLNYKILADWYLNLKIKPHNFAYVDEIVCKYEGNGLSATKIDEPFYKDYNLIILKNYGVFGLLHATMLRLRRKLLFILKYRRWK